MVNVGVVTKYGESKNDRSIILPELIVAVQKSKEGEGHGEGDVCEEAVGWRSSIFSQSSCAKGRMDR